MSEHATPEEKTEEPTGRRMGQLRKEGQIHFSSDVNTAISLLSGFLVLFAVWDWFLDDMKLCLIKAFQMIADNEPLTQDVLYDGMLGLIIMFGPELVIVSGVVALAASVSQLIQSKGNVKEKKIRVKLSHLNPISGVKRVFSAQGVMTTLKALSKLVLILPIGYFALKKFAPQMLQLIHMSVEEVLSFTGLAIFDLFWKVMYVLIALAIFDWFWTKFLWLRDNRMTKQEVKDERKAIEGDQDTKRKIQAKGLQRIMQRIQDSVPQADVVITNPTHYAIALKYDRENMSAPQVVAKGKGFLAQRIKRIAREAQVPVLERKVLARALYHSTEVGTEIPYELFKAVAEVMAYVFKLRDPHGYMNVTN